MQSRFEFKELVTNINCLGFSSHDCEVIANNIISKKVLLLALSGKLASGKDSLAYEVMNNLGHTDAVHVYFGDSIKGEVDQIIALILSKVETVEYFVSEIENEQGVSSMYIAEIVKLLLLEKNNSTLHTARDRTASMRRVLQLWGTEVRREQDALYWVNKTLKTALSWACSGKSVYLTDARFPNEVTPAQSVGFVVARVEISKETQESRLLSRDGIAVDLKATMHSSEVALDGYSGFDITINNNGEFEDSLKVLTSEIEKIL
jgi:hypothetical protein